MTRRAVRAGFTLVEMIVALGLFGLIGVAGFTLVEGVTRVQERSQGRLDRIAGLQRGLYRITLDLTAADPETLESDASALAFVRRADGAAVPISYGVVDKGLVRRVGGRAGRPDQRLVPGVEALAVRSWRADSGWRAGVGDDPPRLIELVVTLEPTDDGLSGEVRRVVELAAPQ